VVGFSPKLRIFSFYSIPQAVLSSCPNLATLVQSFSAVSLKEQLPFSATASFCPALIKGNGSFFFTIPYTFRNVHVLSDGDKDG